MGKNRILGLDLARFLTAFGIMAYHYFFIGVKQGFYADGVFVPAAFWGELGVDVFFVISGFVILFSAEGKKTAGEFLKGRVLRIYPMFVICSAFTMLTGMIMPDTSKGDLLFRWANSLTFYSDLWGVEPLSSIYWTLMVEVKFYVLAAVVKKSGVWGRHKYHVLALWTGLSMVDMFGCRWSLFETLLDLKYSGHFALGIVMCLIYKGERSKWMVPISVASLWLIYRNCLSYALWISGAYGIAYEGVDILFAVVLIVALLYLSVGIRGGGHMAKAGKAFRRMVIYDIPGTCRLGIFCKDAVL